MYLVQILVCFDRNEDCSILIEGVYFEYDLK